MLTEMGGRKLYLKMVKNAERKQRAARAKLKACSLVVSIPLSKLPPTVETLHSYRIAHDR